MIRVPLGCVVLLALVAACNTCNLDESLRARAGSSAMDCGSVPIGGDASGVDACVLAALANRTPFIARYVLQGIDSNVVSGVAGDKQGRISFLLWDGGRCRGPGCDSVITESTCEGPTPNTSTTRDPLKVPIVCATLVDRGRACG